MSTSTRLLQLSLRASIWLGAGVGIGWWLALQTQPMPLKHAANQTEAQTRKSERNLLYWYDPMQPQQHFDKPGPSPFMDMDLIPKYAEADSTEHAATSLSIAPEVSQNMGMRLAKVSRIPLSRRIEATGLIGFNERDVAIVQNRSGGFVERVWPLAVGDVVTAGQPLAEIFVPSWAAAQQEFLVLRELADKSLLTAARERLLLLGMPTAMIGQLEKSGRVQNHYTVSAPIAGVIQALEVRNGMTLSQGHTVAQINGLSNVWLEVAVPEAQAATLQIGDSAQVRLTAFPERDLEGRIFAILPMLNPSSRSIRVRIALKNPRQQLRPGLSAHVVLQNANYESALAVPTEAVIRTGKRNLVMLAGEQGRFMPQEVMLGVEIGNQTIVSAGLTQGQQVVASGQFLFDSEASLTGIPARPITHEPMPDSHATEHDSHDMAPAHPLHKVGEQ